ncbi:acetyltransferase [Algicola sagamiensis]|uniref:acetyltransferase n=1 Tax=Algicola sagamiensis TaxID=163869 RepID=UPI00037D001C|nr:acetyltransferase [Algicola sagamiensis]
MNEKKAILLGAGGHANVVGEIALLVGFEVIGFIDPNTPQNMEGLFGWRCLGDDTVLNQYNPKEVILINGIGSLPKDKRIRETVFQHGREMGFQFATLVHPKSVVSSYATLGEGVQVMAGAMINPYSQIGENTVVNTGAVVEHDSQIGRHCHIAPRAVLCGNAITEEHVHIGAGSTVIQNITIRKNAVIGAGCAVTRNIEPDVVVYPARPWVKS